jgi:hypothetical protein
VHAVNPNLHAVNPNLHAVNPNLHAVNSNTHEVDSNVHLSRGKRQFMPTKENAPIAFASVVLARAVDEGWGPGFARSA